MMFDGEHLCSRYLTRLRLLLGGQDTPEVLLEEGCSLLGIRGEISTVRYHQRQIGLLHSGGKKATSTFDLETQLVTALFQRLK